MAKKKQQQPAQIAASHGFKDSPLGRIPEEWDILSIEKLIKIEFIEKPLDGNHGNLHPTSDDFVDEGIPFIMANNIHNGYLDLQRCNFIRKEQANNLKKGFSISGDVLLTHKGTVGNVAIVGKINTEYIMLTPQVTYYRVKNKNKIINTYIGQYFLSNIFQNILQRLSGGGTRSYIGITSQRTLPFILPPLPEQSAIALILSTLDEAIEKTDRLIAKYKRIKQGMMQDLFRYGIDKNGWIRSEQTHRFKDSPLGRIPEEWEVHQLSKLTNKIIDGAHHTPNYVDDGVPFVTVKNLTSGDNIDLADVNFVTKSDHLRLYKRADPRSGDILVTKDGTLGIARIVTSNLPEFSIFVSVAQLRANPNLCIPELILSFFNSGSFEAQLGTLSAGTGLRHIHLEHFRAFLILTPPLSEQSRIASILSTSDEAIEKEEAYRHKLLALKRGLMEDLLTGKIRVPESLMEEISHA